MINIGDIVQIENCSFVVARITRTHAALTFTDAEQVTHLRWVSYERLLQVAFGGAA